MIERREKILKILNESDSPIKGSSLGKKFQVSRQVIVQDIALLRAEGNNILSTNRGYLVHRDNNNILKAIVSQHSGYNQMEDELNIIVDFGGRIRDVMVDHPVYGEIRASLEINNRSDVREFIEQVKKSKAEPLSLLTEGVHMHTIEVENLEMFKAIETELNNKGYLTK